MLIVMLWLMKLAPGIYYVIIKVDKNCKQITHSDERNSSKSLMELLPLVERW